MLVRSHRYPLDLISDLERRQFLQLAGVSVLLISLYKIFCLQFEGKRLVRPPGSIVEDAFVEVCIKCGACAQKCPTGAIVLATLSEGFKELGTPTIDALRGPCERIQGKCEEDASCERICPTGAIQRVDRDSVKTGSSVLNTARCIAWGGGSCLVCYEVCPVRGAISLTDEGHPVFHSDLCVGCGRCVYACPAQPKALTLAPDGEKRSIPR